jgi:hypothetical protein
MTESKEKIFSLNTLGLGWLVAGKPDKATLKENSALDDPEAAARRDVPVPRRRNDRRWWGAKKVKIPPKTAPGGGEVEKAKEEGKTKKPAFVARQTEYDLEEDDQSTGYGGRDSRPRWKDVSWEDLKVGDFVKLENNEAVPAGASEVNSA